MFFKLKTESLLISTLLAHVCTNWLLLQIKCVNTVKTILDLKTNKRAKKKKPIKGIVYLFNKFNKNNRNIRKNEPPYSSSIENPNSSRCHHKDTKENQ